ncbi:hypothetical protein N8T08_003144 [Aspergillus melleus]|uniref:Uncharacterized protein n=1 Tax=Aspergillus melleus TaxID=138277 RepID=A0ACC3B7U4_9EURO|nr:hypothetical protein N8T08_003144 [Aspergillus melleus]
MNKLCIRVWENATALFLSLTPQDTSTTLAVMENGNLRLYLSRNKPSQSLQLTWFRVIACTLASIHERRIIVADIASRNFLLDSGLSIKVCDFTESTIMPLNTCMEAADDGGIFAVLADAQQDFFLVAGIFVFDSHAGGYTQCYCCFHLE